MNRIETFLSSYDMSLSDCHPDWIEMVDEYNGIRSALPENIREQKENAIIALFPNYHTVEDVEVEKKPIIPVETKKRKPAAKEKTQKQVYSHDFDAKALLEKADNVLKDID